MACWNVCRPTLLIPYGLKSILECVCRAIKVEEPQHIQQFIAAYCKDLLEHRNHAPSHDLHQVIHLYQKMRERGQVKTKSWRASPDQAMLPCGEPAEMCQDLPRTRSTSLVSCRLVDDALDVSQRTDVQPSLAQPKSPTTPDDPPLARVQSAVFQRVPSRSDFSEAQGTVLVDSAMAPPADVIVVHGENLPDAIVFQLDSRPTSASSVRSSVTRTPSVTDLEETEGCSLEMDSGGMVVFERVPSKEDCLPPQPAVDAEAVEQQNSETIDKPLIPTAQEQNSGKMEEQAETLKMAASLESFRMTGISSKRSLVKVFSAHFLKTEDSVDIKVDDQSEQSDRDRSPRISPKTSITVIECPVPSEPAKNEITTNCDAESPTEQQATDSAAKPGSYLVSSNDLADVSENKPKPLMANTVGRSDSADKFKSMAIQLSEECLAEAVEVLEGNKESSESLPNDGDTTERNTPPRVYPERVAESGVTDVDGVMRQAGESQDVYPDPSHLAETAHTVMPVSGSVSPLSTVEREGTVALEQAVEETPISAAVAGVTVSPAECSGTENTERSETVDIHTLENVTSVGSPVQLNLSEMVDADHLNVVKDMCEPSAFDNSELPPFQHQPEETSDSVVEHIGLTSTADEDDLNASNTACISCETVSPLCTAQRNDETVREPPVEDALNPVTACISRETVSPLCTAQRDEETVQEPPVEDALNPATACISRETVSPLCTEQRNEETEVHEPSVEDALNPATTCISRETVSPLCTEQRDEETVQEPLVEDALNPAIACIPRETVSPLCTLQRDEEAEVQEPSVEDALNPAIACISCETVSPLCTVQRDEETEVQEPSVEDALNPATPVESVLPAEISVSDHTKCPERAENVLQEDVESAAPICCGTYATERFVSEPAEESMDSTTVVTSSCEQNMSEITETAPAPQTLETDASPTLSPVICPEPEVPQTAVLELEPVSPFPIGLVRDEATALQPSGDGASCASSVVNDERNSSDSEIVLLKSGLLESSETQTSDRIETAGIVVPKDMEAVSTGCSGDITEESPCQPAEDSVDHRVSSPTVSSQETMNENTRTDDLTLVPGTSDPVVEILELSPRKRVPSAESVLTVDAPAQLFTTTGTTTEENPNVLKAMDSTNVAVATVPSQEVDMSRSRGTTDRGTSPGIPPRTSSVLGCVHASTQVSCVSVEETARDTQGDQNPASGSQLPAPPCAGDETTAPPTKSIQTENVQEKQQQHTEDAVTGRGTPVDTVLQSSANQMWTLYRLPHSSDEGTLSTQVLSQPPFNGSALVRAFGPGHVLMAERSPTPSSHDLQQAPGWPPESTVQAADHPHHPLTTPSTKATATAAATDAVRPSASLPDTDTVEISLPNFLLCVDERTRQATALLGVPGGSSPAVRVRRDDAAGVLSLSVPSASLGGSQGGSGQAQFLQLTTEDGRTVYSPAVVRIATRRADQSK
ncbi:mucin-2-like isoform X2 [Sardina pilchardus]|uniref:mucin-2-like isoform X2 n=1 Tax=Sardina pilchardus TaxID=27697 RepID=UPI002E11A8CA